MAEKKKTIEGFGLGVRERELKNLEEELGVKIRENPSPSLEARGEEFLEISFGGTSISGIYRGMTEDGFHLINPTTFPTGQESQRPRDKYEWREDFTYISGPITGFRPVTKAYLEAIAQGFDKVEHLGNYSDKNQQLNLFE